MLRFTAHTLSSSTGCFIRACLITSLARRYRHIAGPDQIVLLRTFTRKSQRLSCSVPTHTLILCRPSFVARAIVQARLVDLRGIRRDALATLNRVFRFRVVFQASPSLSRASSFTPRAVSWGRLDDSISIGRDTVIRWAVPPVASFTKELWLGRAHRP